MDAAPDGVGGSFWVVFYKYGAPTEVGRFAGLSTQGGAVGGHGYVELLTMTNSDGLNPTAYAVKNGADLCVTIVNKENGAGARNAAVSIADKGLVTGNAAAMFLAQSDGDVTATNGVTLGGATISGASPWRGQWTALGTLANGQCRVTVPAGSAAIVRISAQ